MKQQIKAILEEERGVSPVIGVILMVAITVILAAVIGTFVLGLGDSLQQAPQAQLDVTSESQGEITISHNGGDTIQSSDITVNLNASDNTSNFFSSSSEFSVGDSVSTTDDTAAETNDQWEGHTVSVTIIHNPSESILLETEVDVQA